MVARVFLAQTGALQMWKAAESWGAAHPIALSVGAFLLGSLPTGVLTYNAGFYEGSSTSDSNWRKTFDNKLKASVDEQIQTKCGEITQQLNMSCQRTIKGLESTISEKSQGIAELQVAIERLTKRSDIMDTHNVLAESGSSILEGILAARSKRDRDSEAAGRARFFSLLSAIRRTNEIYAEWSALFDSKATELFQRYNNKENVSTDEIVEYLQEFTSNLDAKRKVIQNQVNEANKIKGNKY
jgi:hypothetical protein